MQTAALLLRFASATTVTNYERLVKPAKLETILARYVNDDLVDLVGIGNVQRVRFRRAAEWEMM